jgi:hypothetical protein
MPKSVNRTFLLGNVGKDPQISSTPGGLAANLSLATTDREKDPQGNWTDRTEWHSLVAYGRTAEIVCHAGSTSLQPPLEFGPEARPVYDELIQETPAVQDVTYEETTVGEISV